MNKQSRKNNWMLIMVISLMACIFISICLFPINNVKSSAESSVHDKSTVETSAEEAIRENYRGIGTTEDVIPLNVRNNSFSIVNIIFMIGAIILAFLSFGQEKLPLLTYVAIAVGLIVFMCTTGFRNIVTVNIYTMVYACILAITIFEYVVAKSTQQM